MDPGGPPPGLGPRQPTQSAQWKESRFITPNRVRRHRRRLQANASRLGGGNVPNPSRFQAITIWTTEWDATGPNFMSDGFRPETYPLWTAERPAVHPVSY